MSGQWQQGVLGCFNNMGICLITFVAPCYTFGKFYFLLPFEKWNGSSVKAFYKKKWPASSVGGIDLTGFGSFGINADEPINHELSVVCCHPVLVATLVS